jgi:hypothetical protein
VKPLRFADAEGKHDAMLEILTQMSLDASHP